MTAVRAVAAHLCAGSAALCRAYGAWLLPGSLGTASARLAGSAATGAFVGLMLYGSPALLWLAAGAWCVASWRTAVTSSVSGHQEAPGLEEGEFLDLLRATIGDARGVHLATLRDRLDDIASEQSWDIPAVRALCDAAGVAVRPSVRVRGLGVSVGVHADDVPAPPLAPSERGPVGGSSAGHGSTTATTTPRVVVQHGGAQTTIYPAREGVNES
ncbi:hypothetical protein [Streptomyces sp. SYSU K21746]